MKNLTAILSLSFLVIACGASENDAEANAEKNSADASIVADREKEASAPEPTRSPADDELTEEDYESMSAVADENFRQRKGAYVEYDGVRFELTPYASCGASDSGSYNTWAATMLEDEPSVIDSDKPRVHVFGTPDWSAIEFYLGGTEAEFMLRHEGVDRVPFNDGYYAFNGETDTAPPKSIEIRISCG